MELAREWTADRILELAKAAAVEGKMTPSQAAAKAVPRDVSVLPASELREAYVEVVARRVSEWQSRQRYRPSEDTQDRERRLVKAALERLGSHISEEARRQAGVLVRTPFMYDGARYSLLEMPREGAIAHRARTAEIRSTAERASEYWDWHIKACGDAGASTLEELIEKGGTKVVYEAVSKARQAGWR